eukprot:TRINITY_DN61389_c0_g1_i2.p1 TRINITY_DN61389_c0_g1~~TRINITY_DN61389_c0_g1_i2.p1  ORF type:complete len:220 (-),score=12.17 TRINITY_DN61389_c0_g1_i2:214-873(-)
MGQDQGKPTVDKESEEYKQAQSHFSVVKRAQDVKHDESATDVESTRLIKELDGLTITLPLLRSSIENSLLSGKRTAAIYEISKQSPVFMNSALPLPMMYSMFAILQTMDNAESTAAIATQEEINNRLHLLKYHLQRLEVTASNTHKSAVTMTSGLANFEKEMLCTEVKALSTSAHEVAQLALQVDALLGEDERIAVRKEVDAALEERMAASLRRNRESS